MWQKLGAFLSWISQLMAQWAQWCGQQPPVQEQIAASPSDPNHLNYWQVMQKARTGIRLMTKKSLKNALANRTRNGRNQEADNSILTPLSTSINLAIEQCDFRLAATVFQENYANILEYEQLAPPSEVHKGALAFDVARAYLQGWDFFAAMHYFELAQDETVKTTNDNTFSIYSFDLFEKNFWDAVQVDTSAHPISIYDNFWQTPYSKQSALDDYWQMSKDSKLAYIIASAERIRLQNIADHSGWDGSEALRLGYWTLAADLARLLEVEAKRRYKSSAGNPAPAAITIVPCLEGGFSNTSFGNISHELRKTQLAMFPRKCPPGHSTPTSADLYEAHFDNMLARIQNNTLDRKDRICTALYLLGFTRNQVAHRIDKNSKLFNQLDDAKFLVDLFLTLCRTKEWMPL